jgi:membrane-bound lytic murein transglycosylase D
VPEPVQLPSIDASPPAILWEPDDLDLPRPVYTPSADDPLLGSPVLRDPGFQREVTRWIEFWRGPGARWFPDYLNRMTWFASTVDSALAARGLPPSLRYLPIVESGYNPRAVSRSAAVGLWQFTAPTARGFGMEVGPLIDERRNPFLATNAAGDYLLSLQARFGSWFLALAAYNAGPNRVSRLLDLHAPLTPLTDALYWEIRAHLPRETRDFLPRFFAAAALASNPAEYGLADPIPGDFLFDEVTVPDATTLDVVAEAAAADQGEIERLNPEVVRGITPPGIATTLRVPRGRGEGFAVAYARIPPEERVTIVEHRVTRGETFTHIARRYGVPVPELRAANPGVEPRRLQIGQRITVPIVPRRSR